jgi:Nuclease-related domain
LYLFRAFFRSKKRPSPSRPDFLRAPGQSAGQKIDDLNGKIERQAALLIALPLFLASIYLSHRYLYKTEINPILVQIVMLAGAGLGVYFLVRILKLIRERRMARLGYEDEIVVGRELDRLVLEGNHVYHDFPAEDANIDHIVVGRSGIFAVATGARLKKAAAVKRIDDATVEYNGKILMFPNGDDYNTIAHAERQAAWISEWISSAVGQQIAARAIVALPGWFVKRTSPDGISVVNPNQFPSLFRHIKPRVLSDEMITQIVSQIEQKCRDVKPAVESQDGTPT